MRSGQNESVWKQKKTNVTRKCSKKFEVKDEIFRLLLGQVFSPQNSQTLRKVLRLRKFEESKRPTGFISLQGIVNRFSVRFAEKHLRRYEFYFIFFPRIFSFVIVTESKGELIWMTKEFKSSMVRSSYRFLYIANEGNRFLFFDC